MIGVMALDIADGRIQGIRSIVNPDKLGHLGQWPTCARCCAAAASPSGARR